jgi:hypothetical protein
LGERAKWGERERERRKSERLIMAKKELLGVNLIAFKMAIKIFPKMLMVLGLLQIQALQLFTHSTAWQYTIMIQNDNLNRRIIA